MARSSPLPLAGRGWGQGYRIWRWFDLQLESWNRGCSCFATFESSASRLRTIGIGNFQMRFPCPQGGGEISSQNQPRLGVLVEGPDRALDAAPGELAVVARQRAVALGVEHL